MSKWWQNVLIVVAFVLLILAVSALIDRARAAPWHVSATAAEYLA